MPSRKLYYKVIDVVLVCNFAVTAIIVLLEVFALRSLPQIIWMLIIIIYLVCSLAIVVLVATRPNLTNLPPR